MTLRSIFLGTAAVSLVATGAVAADLPEQMEPAEYVQVCDVHGSGFFRLPGFDTCLRVGGDVRARYNFHSIGEVGEKNDERTARINTVVNAITLTAEETTTNAAENAAKLAEKQSAERKRLEDGGYSLSSSGPTVQPYAEADSTVGYNARGRIFVDARTQSDWGTIRAYTKVTGTAGVDANIDDAFMQVGNFVAGRTGSFSNLTYGSYAFNNNYGTYDPDQTVWLVGYSMPVGYGVTISASVEEAVSTGFEATSLNASYNTESLSSKFIPDVSVGAELSQGWGKVGVSGGLHALEAKATELIEDGPAITADAEAEPTDVSSFGFFGGGGVEINILSTTKVGANGFYAVGALKRIGAGGFVDDAMVQTPEKEDGTGEVDDEILSASGFTANGGLTHSFSSDFGFHVNGGFFSVTDAKEEEAKSFTGFMAGGSFDYKPVANTTFSIGGEFTSYTKTIAADAEATTKHADYKDVEATHSNFAVTANISQSF